MSRKCVRMFDQRIIMEEARLKSTDWMESNFPLSRQLFMKEKSGLLQRFGSLKANKTRISNLSK